MSFLINLCDFSRPLAVISTVLCTTVLSSYAPSSAQYYDIAPHALEIQQSQNFRQISLRNALSKGRVRGSEFADAQAVRDFYTARFQEPYWMSDAGPYSRAMAFRQRIEEAWTHGLNPQNYHLKQIDRLFGDDGTRQKVALELLLTDAYIRYARDLSGMRIAPEDMNLEAENWRLQKDVAGILDDLSNAQSFDAALAAIEPEGKTYKALQKELLRLAKAEDFAYEQHLPIQFGGIMKPGWGHREVKKLRQRLGVTTQVIDPYRYDDTVSAAVMKFQKENGLNPDGVLGTATIKLLNRTREEKMLQLMANMERLRWAKPDKPRRYVVVNIPSATLWAIDDAKVAMEMDVIVGSPWRRTSMFETEISGIRLNPDWTVPATIKRFDILPKVQEDPNYLDDKGIELFKGYGSSAITLDPDSIDWNTISWQELQKIRFVQIPGEHNPLGQVRVLMPNKYNIYLHDTNRPEYFERSERAVSSGCIRMREPRKMAEFILGQESHRVSEILKTKTKTDIRVTNKMPVYIYYYTAWLNDRGEVVYGSDIYNYDTKLVKLLHAQKGLALPPQNIPEKIAHADIPVNL